MWYAVLAMVSGVVGALFPERVIKLGAKLGLGPLYENAGDLEPRPWYVRSTRIQSAALALAGGAALAVGARETETADGDDETSEAP